MFEDEIHLKLDDIEHFAPFHIVWDDKGTAKTISNKFIRFMGIMDIQEIQENLWVLEPFSAPFNRRLFADITKLILHIGLRDNPTQVLKGELVKIEGGWLFSGCRRQEVSPN